MNNKSLQFFYFCCRKKFLSLLLRVQKYSFSTNEVWVRHVLELSVFSSKEHIEFLVLLVHVFLWVLRWMHNFIVNVVIWKFNSATQSNLCNRLNEAPLNFKHERIKQLWDYSTFLHNILYLITLDISKKDLQALIFLCSTSDSLLT